MITKPQRTCPAAATSFLERRSSVRSACCARLWPAGLKSGEFSASEEAVNPTREQAAQRFEHYELVTGGDGKPVELGRGAMGVTYKAVHVDLHCPVTLKVISERYLGDESARLRFLREASISVSCSRRTTGSSCPKGNGILPNLVWSKVLSCQCFACWVYLTDPLTKKHLQPYCSPLLFEALQNP